MSAKTFTWDLIFITENPDPDTGLVRDTGEYVNDTRQSLTERLIEEHTWDVNEAAPQANMGAHKEGSAKGYYEDTGPTLRPDGSTVLNADDAGRLWFDSANGQIKGWNGTAWVNLSAQGIGTILRWQNSAQYNQNEIVEYFGTLWKAVALLPTVGAIPAEPDWLIFEVGLPNDLVWISIHTYTAGALCFSGGLFWLAVAPVVTSVPGVVPGEWAPLEMDTQSIADDAITQPKIGPQAVGTDELEDAKVTTAKITDLNVTTGKLEDDAVTTVKITDLNVTTGKLEDDTVTTVKVIDAAITLPKLDETARGLIIWQTGYTYSQNEIVNYGGTWWIATAASPTSGVAPALGSGDWNRWTDQTTEAVSNTASISAGYRDHTVFADTGVNPSYAVTLPDGYATNDKITLAVFGGGEVQVAGTGLTDQTQTDTAIEYLWSGTAWFPLGGGSGGATSLALGEVTWLASPLATALPEGKLVCDGSIVNIADYASLFGRLGITWGGNGTTTFGLPNLQGIFPGALGTQDINGRTKGDATAVIGDSKEDQLQDHAHLDATPPTGRTQGDWGFQDGFGNDNAVLNNGTATTERVRSSPASETDLPADVRTGDHTDVSRAIGRWVIQAEAPAPQEVNAVVIDVTIGSVRWWGSDTIDQYDLLCNGQSVAVATYPELYAIIGYTFGGSGDNFNLPNFQGIFPGAKGTQDINGRTKGDGTAVVGDAKEDQLQGLAYELTETQGTDNVIVAPNATGSTKDGTGSNLASTQTNPAIITGPAITDGVNGTPRIGEYTDVSRLIGNWVIRAKNQAAYIIGDQDALVTAVLDRVFPVGSIYTQLPGKDTPAVLNYPGTWGDISSEFAGDFFRVDGGDASAFESGQQVDQNKSHIHQWYNYIDSVDSSGIYAQSGSNVRAASWNSGGSQVNFLHNTSNPMSTDWYTTLETANGSAKSWPENRTMRIWERTS